MEFLQLFLILLLGDFVTNVLRTPGLLNIRLGGIM